MTACKEYMFIKKCKEALRENEIESKKKGPFIYVFTSSTLEIVLFFLYDLG